jgi:F-type H+-transporting ATPase subunit a
MPEQLWITALLNHWFAGPANAVLGPLGLHAKFPSAPISNAFAMELLVFGLLIAFFLLVRASLSVDRPGALQHVVEGAEGFLNNQSEEIIGHHSEGFTPFLMALGLFIFLDNLIGLIPGFESPTAAPSVTLGCAIVAFIYYNVHGIRHQGIGGYLMHFFGPPMPGMSIFIRIPLALLLLPIEIASHLARIMSLTIRLFANMFAGDMVTLVFFSLVPIGVPVLFLAMHLGVSLLQTYIFVLMTTIYLAGAVAEEH